MIVQELFLTKGNRSWWHMVLVTSVCFVNLSCNYCGIISENLSIALTWSNGTPQQRVLILSHYYTYIWIIVNSIFSEQQIDPNVLFNKVI